MRWASLYPDFDAMGPVILTVFNDFLLHWLGGVAREQLQGSSMTEPSKICIYINIYITCETLSNIHQEPRLKHVEYVAKGGNLGGCFDMFLKKLGEMIQVDLDIFFNGPC